MGTPHCEVICVIDKHCLIDSESYQRRYRARHPLELGCYLIVWPAGGERLRYDESADFVGPFESKRLAELAGQGWARARVPVTAATG